MSSPGSPLAPAEQKQGPEAHLLGSLAEQGPAHEPRPSLGKFALGRMGVIGIKILRTNGGQDRVSQEFEPLVIGHRVVFVGVGTVSESEVDVFGRQVLQVESLAKSTQQLIARFGRVVFQAYEPSTREITIQPLWPPNPKELLIATPIPSTLRAVLGTQSRSQSGSGLERLMVGGMICWRSV